MYTHMLHVVQSVRRAGQEVAIKLESTKTKQPQLLRHP